jgi:tetratricopeptide (TPR) repeat protein
MVSGSSSPYCRAVLDRVRSGAAREGWRTLGARAVARGFLRHEDLESCLTDAGSLPDALLSRGWVTDVQLKDLRVDEDVAALAGFLRDRAAALPPEIAALREDPERRLDDYVLVAPIGSGGFGEVWKAWDLELGRWVAIKILRLESLAAADRFLREARLAARITHDGVVQVYSAGVSRGRPFIVMRYMEGGPVAVRPDQPRRAVEAVRDAARAMDVAHANGIIHRDLKPSNLLLDAAGKAHVADFGLAREVEGALGASQSNAVAGTPGYMSPEQARGDGTRRPASDIFSLGATLFHLSTGQLPYEGRTSGEILLAVVAGAVRKPRAVHPGLHRDVEAILLKAMEPDPRKRYPSAGALADDLDRFLAGAPIEAEPDSAAKAAARWVRRNRPSAVAAVVVLAAVVSGSVVMVSAERRKRHVIASAEANENRKVRVADILAPATNALDRWEFQWIKPSTAEIEQMDRAIRSALELEPESGLAWVEHGRNRIMQDPGRSKEAIQDFTRALSDPNVKTRALYYRAKVKLGQLGAVRIPLAPFRVGPDQKVFITDVPPEFTAERLKVIDEALADLEAYVALVGGGRTDPRYRYAKAVATWYRKTDAESLSVLIEDMKALKGSLLVSPGELAGFLSQLYCASNRVDEAIEGLEEGIRRGGPSVHILNHIMLHTLLLRINQTFMKKEDPGRDLDRAAQVHEHLILERGPTSYLDVYMTLEVSRQRNAAERGHSTEGQVSRSLKYLDEAARSDPQVPAIWQKIARVRLLHAAHLPPIPDAPAQLEKVIVEATKAMQKGPDRDALVVRSSARVRWCRFAPPGHPEIPARLAEAAADLDGASKLGASAASVNLTRAESAVIRAEQKRAAGDSFDREVSEAVRLAEQTMKQKGWHALAHLHRGHARLVAGQFAAARSDLRSVMNWDRSLADECNRLLKRCDQEETAAREK